MSTLTVRVLVFEESAPDGARQPAGAGVHIQVEDIPVGQTKSDGTVTARVPSGRVRITAFLYPTSGGEQFATLTPEKEETVSLILASGKEVAKETELMLAESSDGVLSRSVESITLRFRDDAGSLEIARLNPSSC